jgi:hypothetical protein
MRERVRFQIVPPNTLIAGLTALLFLLAAQFPFAVYHSSFTILNLTLEDTMERFLVPALRIAGRGGARPLAAHPFVQIAFAFVLCLGLCPPLVAKRFSRTNFLVNALLAWILIPSTLLLVHRVWVVRGEIALGAIFMLCGLVLQWVTWAPWFIAFFSQGVRWNDQPLDRFARRHPSIFCGICACISYLVFAVLSGVPAAQYFPTSSLTLNHIGFFVLSFCAGFSLPLLCPGERELVFLLNALGALVVGFGIWWLASMV